MKALYRKAKALIALAELDPAMYCLQTAAGIDPTDKLIADEIISLKKRAKRAEDGNKQLYARMMSDQASLRSEDKDEQARNWVNVFFFSRALRYHFHLFDLMFHR